MDYDHAEYDRWRAEIAARDAELAEMIRDYEEADQAEYAAYMAELDTRDAGQS